MSEVAAGKMRSAEETREAERLKLEIERRCAFGVGERVGGKGLGVKGYGARVRHAFP